jgi:hypothetical protein
VIGVGADVEINPGTLRSDGHIFGSGPARPLVEWVGSYETHFGGWGRGSARTRVVVDGRKSFETVFRIIGLEH